MKGKKALVLISLLVVMTAMTLQFPVLQTAGEPSVPMSMYLHAIWPNMTSRVIDLSKPWQTLWHVLQPQELYCQVVLLVGWIDNCDCHLSVCDKVLLYNTTTQQPIAWYHVDEVNQPGQTGDTEIIVSLLVPQPGPPYGLPQQHKYLIMGGTARTWLTLWFGTVPVSTILGDSPFASREPYFTPKIMWENIMFLATPLPGVVQLAIPKASIQSLSHIYFSLTLGYTKVTLTPLQDAGGWLYTMDCISDVDVHMFNNHTGSYWAAPSPRAGKLAAPTNHGVIPNVPSFPSPGPDGCPGYLPMGDVDGFGDGVKDPKGSSIIYLPLKLSVYSWNGTAFVYKFGGPFFELLTTGNATDVVNQPGIPINGVRQSRKGEPWEFLHSCAPWNETKKDPKVVAAVKYVCVYSAINMTLVPGVSLDLLYAVEQYLVRSDLAIPDLDCDGDVDIFDVVIAAKAFGAMDEGILAPAGYNPVTWGHSPPWPGPYGCTPIEHLPVAPWLVKSVPGLGPGDTPPGAGCGFDARADIDNNGLIDIFDVAVIAKAYESKLDP